ncbi:MAG: ABC transporter ATP-binding protein, partial [Candidatus Omnitrophica bacterium]|nr:ABC transporter ATP-binding protein [Candidatus Omnitrophota bacterium]
DGLSFSLAEGKTLGVVGESGCGKTTLAKIIAQLLPYDSGEILFKGKILKGLTRSQTKLFRKDLQIVFQNPYNSLDPRFTVREIIKEGLISLSRETKPGDILNQIRQVLSDVGISDKRIDSYPHQFSGGQLQRISIARALVLRPKLLILDEPVSSLDVSIQAQIINLIVKLQEKFNLTYLFIAHDLSIVRYISDQVIVLYNGKIVEQAKTEDLFKQPLHPYSELLMSSSLKIKKDRVEFKPKIKEKTKQIVFNNGCSFFYRCPLGCDSCKANEPGLREVFPCHFVACHLLR